MAPRWLISVFLGCHLAALAIAAVPAPDALRLTTGAAPPPGVSLRPFEVTDESSDNAISVWVRPVLDVAAGVLNVVANGAWQIVAPVRPVAGPYVDALGLAQTWNMFGNPPRGSEYLRLRYYSTPGPDDGAAPLTVATELVFPVAPSTESHVVRAYWQGHRDKAISNAFSAYFQARLRQLEADGRAQSDAAQAFEDTVARKFLPILQFFSDRYARTRLEPGARIIRTEAWYGWANSRQRGEPPLAPRSRAAAIDRYYKGQPAELIPRPVFQPVDTIEQEADLVWMLIHAYTGPEMPR